jgi:hypothetical protein
MFLDINSVKGPISFLDLVQPVVYRYLRSWVMMFLCFDAAPYI